MPNRILKESICTSETIDALSAGAEIFFYHLLVRCDDFGRMDARPSLLRAACFPLRLDIIADHQIEVWLKELVDAELVWTYTVDGKQYLQVTKWDKHQQKRAKYSKYPQPISSDINCNQLPAIVPENRESRIENREDQKASASTLEPEQVTLPSENSESDIKPSLPAPNITTKLAIPSLKVPALDIYVEHFGGLNLNDTQKRKIVETATDLVLWRKVCNDYKMNSTWKHDNIGRMLEYYRAGGKWPDQVKSNGNGHAPVSANGKVVEPDNLEEVTDERGYKSYREKK